MAKLKFNYHDLQSITFQLWQLISMHIVRFLSKITPLNHSFRLTASFAQATSHSFHPLQAKIFAAKNFDEFYQVFDENKQQFSGELLGSVSRHLISLITDRENRLSFDKAALLVINFQSLDVSAYTEKTIISILSVLRTLKVKGLFSPNLMSFKNKLSTKYASLIRERRANEIDIADLISAYNEMAFFRNSQECKIVAGKILQILEYGVAQGRVPMSNNQTNFLLYCLSCRQELTHVESKIREVLLRRVSEQLSSIKLHQLVKVAVNLNRMQFLDMNGEQFALVRLITQKITDNITDLEEESIIEIIRGEFNSKFHGFYRIYEEINNNLFAEISDKGETDLDPDALFKIFSHLSDKIPLESSSNVNQEKFFAFLKVYSSYCRTDSVKSKGFAHKIYSLTMNGFFTGQQKAKVIEIFVKNQLPLSTNLLYEFAIRRFDISSFVSSLSQYDIPSLKEQILFKLGVISYHMAKGNPQAAVVYAQVEQRASQIITTPEQFIDLCRRLSRYSLQLKDFHEAFGKVISKLPNPFLSSGGLPDKYRSFYFSYIHESSRSNRDFSIFVQAHQSAITLQDFTGLLSHYFHEEDAKNKLIVLNRQILQLAVRKVHLALDSKHKKAISIILDLINKYHRLAVGCVLDAHSETSLFKIIHSLISRLDVLTETETIGIFFAVLEKYVTKNYKRYNLETSYRSLLKHLLSQIDRITPVRQRFSASIISAALRLELLTKKALENVNIDELRSLSFFDQSRAHYIKDYSYMPKIERISQGTLTVIFHNTNLDNYLVENEKRIIQIVGSAHPRELSNYLLVYKQHKHPAGRRILAQILNNFIEKVKNLDRIDFIGIFQSAIDNNTYTYYQYKKICEKIVEEFRKRIGLYSMETHMEFIKFLISQPGLNPREYYNQLADFAERREDIRETQYDQLLVRLATTNYLFKEEEIKSLDRIAKRSIHSGLYFFLMVQNQVEPAVRSSYVKDFSQKYNEFIQKENNSKNTLNVIYYHYLKKKYPEETASLNLAENQLHFDKTSVKPKDHQFINTIVQLGGGNYEQLKDFGPDNYFIKIKDCVITFLYPRRVGSYYEHEFFKRAVSTIRGENLTTICIHFTSHPVMLEYINRCAPLLFNQEEYPKALQELKDAERKIKDDKKIKTE